jgi:hypothetical protein
LFLLPAEGCPPAPAEETTLREMRFIGLEARDPPICVAGEAAVSSARAASQRPFCASRERRLP